jgi:thiol-disulfide isomerase/thioredoxin
MAENFDFLFYYLEKENISIDKSEFEFQIKSHPDYPSLLAIADALSFFNINNGAMRVEISQIEFLPNLFVALLRGENNMPQLYFIEEISGNYFCKNDKKTISITKQQLEHRWLNLVLFVEKPDVEISKSRSVLSWIAPLVYLGCFLLVLNSFKFHMYSGLFFIFPALGILFSVAALKDLFGAKSQLISNFCNISATTSCDSIISSTKWKFFEWVSFSDLSIIFFATQFLGLFAFILTGNCSYFFVIQSFILCFSIPVILLSLYFQKFVEKKWCPICLVIIGIVLFELGYLFLAKQGGFSISIRAIILFLFVFLSVSFIWIVLKKILESQKNLKEFQFKANRFIRNYEIFKNNLFSKRKVFFPEIPIIIGNKESKTIITIISSPFCGHCKKAHDVLEQIVENHSDNLQVQIILKVDLKNQSEENKLFFRSLYKIHSLNDTAIFIKALKDWFNITDLPVWFSKYPLSINDSFDEIMQTHYNWCDRNSLNFTPAIFINGFEYPELYERENLEYFINELIEDEF